MSAKKLVLAATAAVVTLAGAIAVAQEVGRQPASSRDTVENRLAALEQKVAVLEQQNAQLREFITVSGSSLTIKSAQALTIQAGTNLLLKSTAGAALEGGGTVQVKGAQVHLNGSSGKPAARVGDLVQLPPNPGPSHAPIVHGSASVFIGG